MLQVYCHGGVKGLVEFYNGLGCTRMFCHSYRVVFLSGMFAIVGRSLQYNKREVKSPFGRHLWLTKLQIKF